MRLNVKQHILDYEGKPLMATKTNSDGSPVLNENHKLVQEPETHIPGVPSRSPRTANRSSRGSPAASTDVKEPGCSRPSNIPAPSWRSGTTRLRLRTPGPPRRWLRPDVARVPTGDWGSAEPAVGAAFPGAGKVGGVGVPGT